MQTSRPMRAATGLGQTATAAGPGGKGPAAGPGGKGPAAGPGGKGPAAGPGEKATAAGRGENATAAGPRESKAAGGPGDGYGDRFRHEVLAVVFRVRDRRLEVLLWHRALPPCEGCWSLPGGPLGAGERLGASLGRHLAVKVDLHDIGHLEQLETRSDPQRHPDERVLATAYLALVATDVDPRVPADTAWHPVGSLPPTAFDHESIIGSARERLRTKLSYTNLGFALAPATFTVNELREIYAAALGHPVSATNLQRILVRRGVIEATSEMVRPAAAGGRPATLYRFAGRGLRVTNPFAAFRPPPDCSQERVRERT